MEDNTIDIDVGVRDYVDRDKPIGEGFIHKERKIYSLPLPSNYKEIELP